jgi:hypothetical protein
MAADSQENAGGIVVGRTAKIVKRDDGAIAAAAGESSFCAEFLRLFKEGCDEQFRPAIDDDRSFAAVVITPDRQIWQITPHGRYQVDAPFYAEGSAYQILIGAMAAGASAKEAVQIACKYDTRCGGEIHVAYSSAVGAPVPVPPSAQADQSWSSWMTP